MEESLLQFLAGQINSTKITCQMNHPDPANPTRTLPCTRDSDWTATVHDCALARITPGAGSRIAICDEFLTAAKELDYPYQCTLCYRQIGHFVHLVWEIEPLR